MEQTEKRELISSSDKDNLSRLQGLSKEEIIQEYAALDSALNKMQEENKVYRELLKQSMERYKLLQSKNPDISHMEYNRDWSWVNKIVFVLKKIQRPLLSSEIIAFITPYESVLQNSRHKAQSFSANLHKAVKYQRVIAYKLSGSRGYYYILPEWRDDEGVLLNEYENKIFFK